MSAEPFLQFYETFARRPKDEINSLPKGQNDFRERVRRETFRGRYAVFHDSVEGYLYRHLRAYTVPRAFVFWFGSVVYTVHAMHIFMKTFPNIQHYGKFSNHPNYKLLGPIYANFYRWRPVLWGYVAMRLTRWFYQM